jgi:exodeoxyribonuclease VII small subunit
MPRPKSKDTAEDFEKSIKKLEEIVRTLEQEEVSLEISLKLYEEGLALARACESKLQAAENRIKQLLESERGKIREVDFEPSGAGEAAAGAATGKADEDEEDKEEKGEEEE